MGCLAFRPAPSPSHRSLTWIQNAQKNVDFFSEIVPDFSWVSGNEPATKAPSLPFLVCGEECTFCDPIRRNPTFAGVDIKRCARQYGCSFCVRPVGAYAVEAIPTGALSTPDESVARFASRAGSVNCWCERWESPWSETSRPLRKLSWSWMCLQWPSCWMHGLIPFCKSGTPWIAGRNGFGQRRMRSICPWWASRASLPTNSFSTTKGFVGSRTWMRSLRFSTSSVDMVVTLTFTPTAD